MCKFDWVSELNPDAHTMVLTCWIYLHVNAKTLSKIICDLLILPLYIDVVKHHLLKPEVRN